MDNHPGKFARFFGGFERPFPNMHWAGLIVLVGLWQIAWWGSACSIGPFYWQMSLFVSTVFIALWAADRRTLAEPWILRAGRIAAAAAYDLVKFLLLVILVGLPLAIVMPTYQCYTPRAYVAEVVVASAAYRSAVADRARAANTLKGSGHGLVVKVEGRVSGGFISEDGTIMLMSAEPPAIVIFRPTYEQGGGMSWTCSGTPVKLMPAACRDAPLF